MSASNIRAGQAYVELSLKNKISKGLGKIGAELKAFGNSVKSIGKHIAGIGAALRVPLAAAEAAFTEIGAEMARMSQRTGIGVEALSQLGYAAENSGVSMEQLEVGIKKMERGIGEAEQGNNEAIQSFARLGISIRQLQGLSPDQQFEVLAERISHIHDPAMRAAVAMQLFGKSGTDLLPLLEQGGNGIQALMQEAARLGYTMTAGDAKAALDLSKAMSELWHSVRMVAFQVGAALAPALLPIIEHIRGVLGSVIKWVKGNKDLLASIAKITTFIVAAGAAVYGLGVAFTSLGAVFGGLAAVVGIALNPFVLIGAAVGGAIFAFVKFTDAGQVLLGKVKAFMAPILQTFRDTFTGIKDAISAGDLALAGKIAFTGLRIAMTEAMVAISDKVGGKVGDFIGSIASKLLKGDIREAWNTALSGLSLLWATFTDGILSALTAVVDKIIDKWDGLTSKIAATLQEAIESGNLLGKILEKKASRDPNKFVPTWERGKDYYDKGTGGDAELQHKIEANNRRLQQNLINAGKGGNLNQLPDQPKAKAEDAIHDAAKALKDKLAKINSDAADDEKKARDKFKQHVGNDGDGNKAGHEELAALQAELNKLLKQAHKEAKDADLHKKGDEVKKGHDDAVTSMKTSVGGTFSGMRARQILGGVNPVVEHLRNIHRTLQKVEKNTKDIPGPLIAGA
jgi:hypothetical protein